MSKGTRRTRRSGTKKNYTPYMILGLVLVLGLVGYYIFTSSGIASSSPFIGQPASSAVLTDLAGVSPATLNAVGPGPSSLVALKSTVANGVLPPVLTQNGKPAVLYIGSEFCPYCAAERWAMITALDKFGNFTGIEYMQSASSPEPYPNTSTFTFVHATYTSNYITFVAVEQKDRAEQPLMTPTANQSALMNKYDSAGSIPFMDFGEQYTLVGSQYVPQVLRTGSNPSGGTPYNWTQIASQLDTPSSPFAQNIDGAANRLIAAICKIDGGQPISVCNQTFAQTVAYIRSAPSGSSPLVASDAAWSARPEPRSPPVV